MEELSGYLISTLFDITLYPFTSGTYFVTVPCIFVSIGGCFALVRRIMEGRF